MLTVKVEFDIKEDFQNKINTDILEKIILKIIQNEKTEARNFIVNLTITDNKTIQEINFKYRQIDAPTDVLSFPMLSFNELDVMFIPPGQPWLLGDIVISFEKAQEQSLLYGHSLLREICYLCAHGMLHLLGYDHEEDNEKSIMRKKEEAALQDID